MGLPAPRFMFQVCNGRSVLGPASPPSSSSSSVQWKKIKRIKMQKQAAVKQVPDKTRHSTESQGLQGKKEQQSCAGQHETDIGAHEPWRRYLVRLPCLVPKSKASNAG